MQQNIKHCWLFRYYIWCYSFQYSIFTAGKYQQYLSFHRQTVRQVNFDMWQRKDLKENKKWKDEVNLKHPPGRRQVKSTDKQGLSTDHPWSTSLNNNHIEYNNNNSMEQISKNTPVLRKRSNENRARFVEMGRVTPRRHWQALWHHVRVTVCSLLL